MARQIHSLRVRVLGTVAVGSVLLVALFVWIGSFTLDRFIVAQSDGRLLDAAHRTAALIERVLTDRQREAAVIASHPAVVGLLRGGGDARALAELARTLDFADLTVVNPRGAMIATNGALVARLRGDSGWWQPAVIDGASGAVAQLDSAGEQVYLVVTTPVRDAATSRPIGALRAVSPLDNVQSALRRASIGSGIRTDLIDATGHIIVSSAGPSRLAMIGGYEALGGAAADSVFNFDEGPGSRRRATMLFLHGGQWRILTHADRRALVAPTRAARRVLFLGALLMLGALAAGLYAATRYVLRRVSEPAMALAGIAEAVAGGDLSVNVANVVRADGEIDRLRRATDAMIRELRRMASAMRGAAQESAAMSTQITGGTEQMSAAAQEMAQTSNDLSRQAGEMAAVIRAAAADTTRLREISARLTGGAHEGVARNAALRAQAGDSRTRLDASIEAIENLAVEVQTSATAVEALAVASEEIRAFVTLVHKVAKQSKLLALNAAMEAARAGEQGQGFAVVATEVRRLATNSTEAAERTEILVRDIIARIEESRGASAQTVGTVHTVLAATRHGIQSFGRIEQAVHDAEQWTAQTERDATESQALVDSIGQRLDSLARGIDQFAAAMEQVAASSQEQSASTEQIAAAAQALAQAADRLTRLVSIFRLGDEMAATEVHPVRRSQPRKTKELVG